MNVLAVNCGSSTLKFALFDLQHALGERRIAAGMVERIGGDATVRLWSEEGEQPPRKVRAPDHDAAVSESRYRRVKDRAEASFLMSGGRYL